MPENKTIAGLFDLWGSKLTFSLLTTDLGLYGIAFGFCSDGCASDMTVVIINRALHKGALIQDMFVNR